MIHYAPGFVGLGDIQKIIGTITGNEGIGSDTLPEELLVCGKDLGAPIVLRVGANSAILAGFLEAKLHIEIVPGIPEPEIAFMHWIAIRKEVRWNNKPACAKAIIMAYLACNDFIEWAHF